VQQGARREILKADTDNAQATAKAHSESQFTRQFKRVEAPHSSSKSVYCVAIPGFSGGEMAATLPAATLSYSMHGLGCLKKSLAFK
jgi:hypothetical protein